MYNYKETNNNFVTVDEVIELLKEYNHDGLNGNKIIGKKFDRTWECNHMEETPSGYKYKEVLEYQIKIITKEYTRTDEELAVRSEDE